MSVYKIKAGNGKYVRQIFASGMPVFSDKAPKLCNSKTYVFKAMDKLEEWAYRRRNIETGEMLEFEIEEIQ